MIVIRFQGETKRTKQHHAALPHAEIRIVRHTDGRWMWAHSFTTYQGGEGSHPLPKWNRFASSESAAISAGIAEIIKRMDARCWTGPQIEALREWAESLRAPVQADLFGMAA